MPTATVAKHRTQAPARADIEERNRALVSHMPLVRYVANRVSSAYGLATGVEHADLVSWGLFGLLDAWERFDSTRGVKFETFAIPRIRGAIVDELRRQDWVPRNVRTRARKLTDASSTLTSQLGRAPTRDEIAESLGVDELDRFEQRGTPAMLIALEDFVGQDVRGESVTVAETIVDGCTPEPGSAIEDAELRDRLSDALGTIGERDRLILTLYYFENLPLGEIARLLKVTESRVSQLHTRALHSLRDTLEVA